jgi:hypothetical protein
MSCKFSAKVRLFYELTIKRKQEIINNKKDKPLSPFGYFISRWSLTVGSPKGERQGNSSIFTVLFGIYHVQSG